MQAFIVSIVAGIIFPGLPILAEYGITDAIRPDTWSLTGIVYAAAVGLVSRHQAIAISSFVFSAVCALIYAAEILDAGRHPQALFIQHGTEISVGVLYFFAVAYFVERFGRHFYENEPFLEF